MDCLNELKMVPPKLDKQNEAEVSILEDEIFKKFLNKKPKKKSCRKTAPDPRLDPTIDPKRAKRIVANRESAARSKTKQKQHLEYLKNTHKELVAQKLAIQQQIDKSQADSKRLETENKALIVQLELIRQQKKLQQMTTLISLGGLIPSKPDPSNQ